jgi:hypothetical protein
MTAEPAVPLTELERDLPAPADGWAAELDRRGVAVVLDDLGRAAVDRATARALFAEHRESEARAARKREELERQVIAADEARRAALPKGIPVDAVPAGVSAAELLMLSDPFPVKRRQSVLEHALEHPGGATVYTPVGGES